MNPPWRKIIQHFVPPVGEEKDTGEKGDVAPPILRAELQIPHAVVERYEANQHEYAIQEKKRTKIDRWRLRVEVATLVFAIIGAVLLYKTWEATRESNRINREALNSVQRAYVSLKTIESLGVRDAQGKVVIWQFFPQWGNSGATPTKIMRRHANAKWPTGPLPIDFDFHDAGESNNRAMLLAAQAKSPTGPLIVPSGIMVEVSSGKRRLYFWGWAAYRDVPKDSKPHLVEFCNELAIAGGDVTTGEGVKFLHIMCNSHNCANEDCKDYADIEKKLQEH